MLYKICIFLCIFMPVAVTAIAIRAVYMMITGEDTGKEVWSPPSDQKIPAVISLVLIAGGLVYLGVVYAKGKWQEMRKKSSRFPNPRPRATGK